MRIGLVAPGFSASESDWCIPALLGLVRVLGATHEVKVISLRYPHRRSTYRVYGAEVTALGGGQTRGVGRLALLAQAQARIRREARRASFDVLHALWAHEPGFVATLLSGRRRIPTVVSLLGGELAALPEIGYGGALSLVNRNLIRFALNRATRVTVGSQSLRQLTESHVEAHRLRTLPLGVDTELFRPGPRSQPDPLSAHSTNLLNVASHYPVKDHPTLLQAFAAASEQRRDLHLHLVGEGPAGLDLVGTAERLGIASSVTFHGPVPHERLPDYYRAADLCVLSSRFESQGMVILEAAACGKVTVGTRVGLLPELAPRDWTAPPGDWRALADAMIRALEEPERVADAGEAWRLRAAESYGLAVAARHFVSLYEEAAAEVRPNEPRKLGL